MRAYLKFGQLNQNPPPGPVCIPFGFPCFLRVCEAQSGQGEDDDSVEAGQVVAWSAPVKSEPLPDKQLQLLRQGGLMGPGKWP